MLSLLRGILLTSISNSMSHEFYQIMVGSPTMSVHSWKQLALWSLEYSCLKESDKNVAEGYFKDAWNEFCDWVVAEYRDLFIFNADGSVQALSEDRAKEKYRGLGDGKMQALAEDRVSSTVVP